MPNNNFAKSNSKAEKQLHHVYFQLFTKATIKKLNPYNYYLFLCIQQC